MTFEVLPVASGDAHVYVRRDEDVYCLETRRDEFFRLSVTPTPIGKVANGRPRWPSYDVRGYLGSSAARDEFERYVRPNMGPGKLHATHLPDGSPIWAPMFITDLRLIGGGQRDDTLLVARDADAELLLIYMPATRKVPITAYGGTGGSSGTAGTSVRFTSGGAGTAVGPPTLTLVDTWELAVLEFGSMRGSQRRGLAVTREVYELVNAIGSRAAVLEHNPVGVGRVSGFQASYWATPQGTMTPISDLALWGDLRGHDLKER